MKQEVKQGQTDYSVLILIRDTDGAPKTGLVFNSAGIDVCYTRVETDNDVVLTAGAPVDLVTPALTDPHLDWGFLQVDATNAPGVYRLDLPDAVFASGAWSAIVSLICTGCDPTHIEFVLIPESPYNGVDVYSVGGTAQTANDNGADINTILVDTADMQPRVVAIEADTNELQADDYPTSIAAVQTTVDAIEVDTGTTLDTLIKDIPTVAEFEARSIVSADYVVVGDTIAGVTLVATTTDVTNQVSADVTAVS